MRANNSEPTICFEQEISENMSKNNRNTSSDCDLKTAIKKEKSTVHIKFEINSKIAEAITLPNSKKEILVRPPINNSIFYESNV